jgi:hypothetical protein
VPSGTIGSHLWNALGFTLTVWEVLRHFTMEGWRIDFAYSSCSQKLSQVPRCHGQMARTTAISQGLSLQYCTRLHPDYKFYTEGYLPGGKPGWNPAWSHIVLREGQNCINPGRNFNPSLAYDSHNQDFLDGFKRLGPCRGMTSDFHICHRFLRSYYLTIFQY